MVASSSEPIDSPGWIAIQQGRLRNCLSRVETLMREAPDLVHTWRFALGIVYALLQRVEAGRSDETRTLNENDFLPRTRDLLQQVRDDAAVEPEWLAGFWYNAAIMRTDALYERCFRALLQETEKANAAKLYGDLYGKFSTEMDQAMASSYGMSLWRDIRCEVNSLKHFTFGADPFIRMKTERAILALEQLFSLLTSAQPQAKLELLYRTGSVHTGKK